ncbi:O-acyltransferase like protein-like [Plodia interpunctella]|uniref:O-acyltransferase like protein-like n=1 Tax=Plodia interpunctella TaxID=58824 RepID=UPI0023684A89|nr:O-acyltransferase like protein-like [Plodia interpunctella]
MKLTICLLNIVIVSTVNAYVQMVVPDGKNVFDLDLYEGVLDPELCSEQMRIVSNHSELLSQFLDSGIRTPRGILKGNLVDMGNYHQCLEINEMVQNRQIEGKYCTISVPLDQHIDWPSFPDWEIPWPNITLPENTTWPELPWPEISSVSSRLSEHTIEQIKKYKILRTEFQMMAAISPRSGEGTTSGMEFNLALCVPKACTSRDAINLVGITDEIGLKYEENFCRLPKDKKWVAGDYTAIVIFSLLGILTLVSTGYDIRQTIVLQRDPKSVNKLYQSFSVYTNTRRLLTFAPVPGAIECLDGVRAFAMIWVIIGHTFVNQISGLHMANPIDSLNWIISFKSLWITSGPITVDTFFMISGLLVVYSTAGKMTRTKFVKNVHLFYLNRLLRLFPVLAAVILLQVSLFSRMTDGPYWQEVARHTHNCRVYWWSTLLYFQNFYNPGSMCLPHSWYLAIDFHMFLLSPLILFWVVSGRKRAAWVAILTGLLAFLIGSSIYNFVKNFPSASITLARPQDQPAYLQYYYVNTLTRGSPFFVGMIYGYMLHMYRGQKLTISRVSACMLWVLALAIIVGIVCITNLVVQADWDNQLADNLINSYMRPIWALAVGWIVFACSKGYGGPVNWVLCLGMWKLLGRLSYAMYIIHYPLIFVVNGTYVAPLHFSVEFSLHKFCTDFAIAVFSAFVVTLLVDSPCSTLIKMAIGGGPKRPPPVKQPEDRSDVKNRDIDIIISSTPEASNKAAL